ncbi:hypothetical protein [Cellulomonas massiliensis]|uniref:hypothetical protein n=1 Tax=Cellulomonas massiliensis TaxID=1465811 RepID=UPI0002F51745|nr:hypothetical protein [Cellulomonas massiliensis]
MNILLMTETYATPSRRRLAPIASLFQGRTVSAAGQQPATPKHLVGVEGTTGADDRLDLRTSLV